ncbi:M56 family metallopeptidase [Dinghuibacter silviterrae]|uniref:Beta-lactamase regulating signal transducer with metallopeptidase domain n=1 Tax=Dinghuibacter silviterrae TaxID=1539049 RepID=A0A4R8DGD3_9BACT|nr:M56 family metallopeptidase [Dinghuibacter silviterrae]TDW96545.1 beta-lactamase regulating signal transducer with metallopeptidase domain [Dinghuibacter silviterrae]
MIPYIMYVAMVTAVYFLFYRLLLHKETFFRLNRWFFLGGLACSFVLPLLPVPRAWSLRERMEEVLPATTSAQGAAATPARDAAATSVPSTVAPGTAAPDPETFGPFTAAAIRPETKAPVQKATTEAMRTPANAMRTNGPAYENARAAIITANTAPTVSTAPTANTVPTASTAPTANYASNAPSATYASTAPAATPRAHATAPVESTLTGPHTPDRPAPVATTETPGIWDGITLSLVLTILYYGYFCGVLIFAFNLLLQFVVVWYQVKQGKVIRDGAFRIVETKGDKAPCSFGRIIFINPSLYDEETYQQILTHEKVHARGRHSVDILLAELGIVLQWFNPFAWWYRRALEDNLEFLTDAAMINNPRINPSNYQLSLLKVSVPHLPLSITSNYNQSLLKKRILMMHSKQSSAGTTWKYLFLVPLLAVMVCVFNHTLAVTAQQVQKAQQAQQVRVRKVIENKIDTNSNPRTITERDGESEPQVYAVVPNPVVVANPDPLDVSVAVPVPNPMPMVNVHPVVTPVIDVNPMPDVDIRVDGDHRSGTWMATIDGDTVEMTMRSGDANDNWTNTEWFLKSEFSALPTTKSEFTITREAGTLVLNGLFDGNEGYGHFTFKENSDFEVFLKSHGLADVSDDQMFRVFRANVTRKAVEDLAQAGYKQLSIHDLCSLCAMKVDAAYIDSWRQLGYPHLDPHELVSLKALHVDGNFVKEWQAAGFKDLEPRELTTAKAMGITPAYAQTWAQLGYKDLAMHELAGLKSMNVDAGYLKELQDAGLKDLGPHELMAAKSMDIDAAYVKSWSDAGYKDLSIHDLVGLKSQKVDASYIQELKAAGLTDLEPHQLIAAKSMDITPDYVRSWKELGYTDLPIHELVALKSMGVERTYIKELQDAGYAHLEPHELISFKSQGITPGFVKEYAALGFKDIPPHTLVALKSMEITPEYITSMKNKGFVSNDLQEYIKLKTFK